MNPGATENCNGYDEDCDGSLDEGCDTRCDDLGTWGLDVRVTSNDSDSYDPSLVWSGSEYGLSRIDSQDGNYEIYFARIKCNQTLDANA